MTVLYTQPTHWIKYDIVAVTPNFIKAKAALQSLTTVPYQREWVEKLQRIQLKMEVAGTSRIEGADFTDNELDTALKPTATAESLITRSQKQAHAALAAYEWISSLPVDYPISAELVREVHSLMVRNCDDDHCPPGKLRPADHNVTFGQPRHRGVSGGDACEAALTSLISAAKTDFLGHDPIIQAIALHYHLAAMHPFLDGNGRTARAMESFLFQKAGLRDTAFIAMSNYYYDEKSNYLSRLAEVRSLDHDLTPFLQFSLAGLELQCTRLLFEIKKQMQKALFRDTMFSLFNRLRNKRTRVIQKRQIDILNGLLEVDTTDLEDLWRTMQPAYAGLDAPVKAFNRDIGSLFGLGAIGAVRRGDLGWDISANLIWPTQITQSDFFARLKKLPRGKTYSFLK